MKTLIVGDLNPFVAAIANRLNGSCVLANVSSDSNKSWLDSSIKVYYGVPDNENLVANILNNEKVNFIVFVPSGLGTVSNSKQSIVEFAKKQLHGITHFLDGWRKAKNDNEKTLVFLSSFAVYGKNQNDFANKTSLKPATELGAALMGAEAFLHSYAVSYKLNIKILRLRSNDPPKLLGNLINALKSLKNDNSGIAEIFHMPSDTAADFSDDYVGNLTSLPGWNEFLDEDSHWLNSLMSKTIVSAARFLVFGGNGWIGEQFIKLLKEKSIEFFIAETRPGTDVDQKIAEEITKISPSHVVSMIGRTHGPGCGNIDYLEGGPDKLKENVQDNLFAPWILANFCEQFGIHFTYLGTGCLYQFTDKHSRNGNGYKEFHQPNFTGNKYSTVKSFTDQSVTFFKNTLNARIRLPVNNEDSPRNLLRKLISFKKIIDIPNSITYLPDCLPILLNLALQKETGTLNLVNPNTITFPRILEIFQEETGQKLEYEILPVEDDSQAFKTRAQCALDTSRLQSLVPEVLDIESAIRRAVAKVAAHLA